MNNTAKAVADADTRSPWLTPSATPPSSRTLHSTRASSTAPPPFKRPRLASSHPPSSDTNDLDVQRQASTKRLLDVWSQLEERYSRAIDEDDIVDLVSMKVVKDRGQLRSLSKRWDFGFAGDEETRPDADVQLESPIVSEDEDEFEDEETLSADELDVIPRRPSEPDDTGQTGPTTLQEVWNAREALDPDNPSDAEDLDRFLEAERRRKEACGGEEEEDETAVDLTELESTPFSRLDDPESTPNPATSSTSHSSDGDFNDWSTMPPTSDVETDGASSSHTAVSSSIRQSKVSGIKLSQKDIRSTTPKTTRKTAQQQSRPRRPPSLSSDSEDNLPLAQSSSHLARKTTTNSVIPTNTKGRVPHIDFSHVSTLSSRKKPQPRASSSQRSSSTLVDEQEVPIPAKKCTIMEVVLPAPRHQSRPPLTVLTPSHKSLKGKEKAIPPPEASDSDSDSDDPLSQPPWHGRKSDKPNPTPLPAGQKRKRQLSSSSDIEIIEISSDSDSALPPPRPQHRSASRAREARVDTVHGTGSNKPTSARARSRSRSRPHPLPSSDDRFTADLPSSSPSPSTHGAGPPHSVFPPLSELPPIHDPRMQYVISQVVQQLSTLYSPPNYTPNTPRHREHSFSNYHTPHNTRPFPYTQNSDFSVGSLPPSSPEPDSSSPMKPLSSSPPPLKKRASSLVNRSRSRGRRVSFHLGEDERAGLSSLKPEPEPVASTSTVKRKAVPIPKPKKAKEKSQPSSEGEQTRGRSSSRGRTPGPGPESSPTKRAVANKQKKSSKARQ